MRHRWTPAATATSAGRFTAAERSAVYEHAAQAARDAAQQIRHHAATDPADAAWAAADTLNAAARALGNKELRRAADAYDRAARCAYGRLPRPTPTGNRLRAAARILSAMATFTGDPLIAQLQIILQLTARGPLDVRPCGHHLLHQSDPQCLGRAELLGGEQEAHRVAPAGKRSSMITISFAKVNDERDWAPDLRPDRVPPRAGTRIRAVGSHG